MHVGADYHVAEGGGVMSRENLEYNLRFGVRHISPDPDMVLEGEGPVRRQLISPESKGGAFIAAEGPSGGAFDLDKLKRMRDACDAVGMTIEGFRMDSGYIVMKPGAERDRKIDQIIENIRKTHLVGVGLISQHWTMIPIRRNGKEPGRGGSTYETFKLERQLEGSSARDCRRGQLGAVLGTDHLLPAEGDPGVQGIQRQDGQPSL